METNLTVIHTHFHKRRTGVTRSVENILPYLSNLCNTKLYGYGINGNKISTSELKNLLFSTQKTIVHCHRNNEIIKFLWYRFLGAKFKLVATRHAETEPSKTTRFLLKKADEVITLTTSMHHKLGITNTKVPHGVNTTNFIAKNNTVLKNIPQKNIILCAGRVRKAKGHKTLLEAIAPKLNDYKNWALVIVGKVDKLSFLNELQQITTTHRVNDQVFFIDETPEIISYYQAAKITVVPSFTEGFSLVCAEAMACENTVIATKNVGVHSELIADTKTGYLFDSGNIKELQKLVIKLITNELPYTGKEARNEVLKNWSAKKEANDLFEVYKQL